MADTLAALRYEILQFREARDWAQFHTPRNLAAALAIEAAELQETMLWKTENEVADLLQSEARRKVEHEAADVLIYALLLCDAIGADPEAIIRAKLAQNSAKYPVAKARGSATKYNQL